jgi:hypothetical protein
MRTEPSSVAPSRPLVPASAGPLPDAVTSPDGYVAEKDSGSMLYALRLA